MCACAMHGFHQVLREGLEGVRSKTVMLATLSPAHRHAEHTLNTLRYAARLKELPQSAGGGRR
jgi:kinesin family protein 2/24